MIVRIRTNAKELLSSPRFLFGVLLTALFIAGAVMGQQQQSGGGGSAVTLQTGSNLAGKFGVDQTTPGTTNGVALAQIGSTTVDGNSGTKSAGTLRVVLATDQPQLTNPLKVDGTGNTFPITGSIGNTAFALNAGSAIIGYVRIIPPGCGSLVTQFSNATVGVAITTGTTVTSTTTCVTWAYANNITNSAVTLRLADKAGTPVIWLGGNADFSIPANSNIRVPIDGVTFTSGITAIAGTGSAINLQINGLQ